MKHFDNTRVTLLGWTPLVVLGLFLCLDSVLREFFPLSFCAPIDVGAKELVCGFEHSAPLVQTMSVSSFVLYFGALALSANEALKRNLTRGGSIGFAFSLLVVLAGFVLSVYLGSEDSP